MVALLRLLAVNLFISDVQVISFFELLTDSIDAGVNGSSSC